MRNYFIIFFIVTSSTKRFMEWEYIECFIHNSQAVSIVQVKSNQCCWLAIFQLVLPMHSCFFNKVCILATIWAIFMVLESVGLEYGNVQFSTTTSRAIPQAIPTLADERPHGSPTLSSFKESNYVPCEPFDNYLDLLEMYPILNYRTIFIWHQ